MQSGLASLEYVLEVAKDWTVARFAAAQRSDFVLAPHRFELCDHGVRRSMIAPDSAEAESPLDAVDAAARPWPIEHRVRRGGRGLSLPASALGHLLPRAQFIQRANPGDPGAAARPGVPPAVESVTSAGCGEVEMTTTTPPPPPPPP
jgi:hypothetical protein